MAEVSLIHAPSRPEWTCVSDGQEWPCEGAKRELRRLFAGAVVPFAAYLAARLEQAAEDLRDVPEEALLRRFVLWPAREVYPS